MLLQVRKKHIISRLLIVKLTLAFGLLTLYPPEADGKRSSELRELLQQLETGDGKYKLQKSPNRYYKRRAARAAKAEFRDLVRQMRTGGATYKYNTNSSVGGSRYSRKDPTYVKPHDRTATDSKSYNNDSAPGNFTPNLNPISTSTPWKAPNTCDKQRNRRSSPVGIDE